MAAPASGGCSAQFATACNAQGTNLIVAVLRRERLLTGAGRFAPSPTGPLHLGSLVAAAGSWLFARHAGGKWLVRMEDLATHAVVAGSADEILQALERYGLTWDGHVVYQSQRTSLYDEALAKLRAENLVFD